MSAEDIEAVWAAQNGDLAKLKEIIDGGFDDINAHVGTGDKTLLHAAADYGQVECIEFLISRNAKIDVKDKFKITPLLNAIFEGHTAAVKLLLEKGASKDGLGPSGESYIECAEKEEIKQLLK